MIVSAGLALGPVAGAWLAAIEGVLSGVVILLLSNRPRTLFWLLGRPVLRGGLRALGLLAGAWFAALFSGQPFTNLPAETLFGWTLITFPVVTQAGRVLRELLQGGAAAWRRGGVRRGALFSALNWRHCRWHGLARRLLTISVCCIWRWPVWR